MMPLIWLIGGTTEGRKLIKELAKLPVRVVVSVATDYGATLIEEQPNLTVMAKRMDEEAMREFLRTEKPACVVDATHPYATIVTATVQAACAAENVEYHRLVRPADEGGDYITVNDFAEAVELLNHVQGQIFLTTGSKNLKDFTGVQNYAERIALRILPMQNSLQTALDLGYKPANIVCMQGPFSDELNVAMFKKFRTRYMVTKDSGAVGGFAEKVQAAKAVGVHTIVVGREAEEQGADFKATLDYLKSKFQ